MGDDIKRRTVRRSSDRLLAAVQDLKAAERRKREAQMSTPEFRRLAEQVDAKAAAVWQAAMDEDAAGESEEVEPDEQPSDPPV